MYSKKYQRVFKILYLHINGYCFREKCYQTCINKFLAITNYQTRNLTKSFCHNIFFILIKISFLSGKYMVTNVFLFCVSQLVCSLIYTNLSAICFKWYIIFMMFQSTTFKKIPYFILVDHIYSLLTLFQSLYDFFQFESWVKNLSLKLSKKTLKVLRFVLKVIKVTKYT